MPINFPDSPANGAVYTYAGKTFIYDTSKSKWTISNISLESVSSDILPDVDSSRSLGSSTKKWKELYLSGNTLFLGDSGSISSGAGGEISLPSIKIGTGSDAVKLQATGGTLKTANATSGTENAKSGTTTVANLTAMQTLASPIQGDIVNVTANNTIYMYTGTGWFKIATVSNESPTAITGVNSSYGLATDGTPTIIDVVSTDPEGATLIYNYSVISGSLTNGGGTTATVAQGSGANTNRFTITPTQTSEYGGNFNLRFTATDNINVVNSDASFTLSFVVANSRYTSLSVKATNNRTYILSDTHSPDGQHIPLGFVAMPSNQIFTIEGWFRIDSTSAAEIWFFDQHTAGVAGRSVLGVRAGNITAFGTGGWSNGSSAFSDTTTYKHLAWVQNGSDTLNFYVNGVASGTHTAFGQTAQQNTMFGENTAYGSGGFSCKGFRVTNTAVYTSGFTPPNIIGGLTDISGTQVLWDGSVGTATDASSNNRSLTNSGMTFTAVTQTFDDASASNHTITVAGDTTASTFSPHRHGGYSLGLDGTNDYLQVPQTTDLDLTGDFTVECWAYFNDTAGGSGLMGKWGGSGLFGWTLYATAADFWFYTGNSGSAATQGAFTFGAPDVNQWYHLAVSRTGSTISTYVNGTRTTTITDSNNCTANTTLIVGSDGSSLSAWSVDGYMRDVRIVNGTGLYTGTSITVPTEPLTAITNTKFLLGDLPYFKDQSASNHTITVGGNTSLKPKSLFDNAAYSEASDGASAYFDGSGDYLTGPSSATIGIGTGDFTIECWFYATDGTSIDRGIWETRTDGYPNWSEGLSLTRITETTFRVFGTSQLIASSATTITNTWNHLAVVRNSGTLEFFVNGVSQGTASNSTNMNSAQPIAIGSGRYTTSNSTPTHAVKGYIQDFRVTTSAVYTSAFTPPTAPLTAITNTKFLLNPEPTISDLSQSNLLLDFYGNAAVDSTTVKFAGTKSFAFAGSGDYLKTSLTESIKILTDQFTVECWARRVPNTGISSGIFQIGPNAPGNQHTSGMGVFTRDPVTHNSKWAFEVNGTYITTGVVEPSDNVWYHVALVRDSNNLVTLYIDGTSVSSTTSSQSISADYLAIGAHYGSIYFWPGNIQDFRITKGLARYTANFTPPTAELQG